jgi:long-chain acyl-CoA synthetase
LLGLNTLFVALMDHPEFKNLDFSNLKVTNSGGTALVKATAERWKAYRLPVVEGYGLTETSPVASTNPMANRRAWAPWAFRCRAPR